MEAYHALGLHMHQPPGNLLFLLEANDWEARQIIHCYARPLKYAEMYRDVARFQVGFSGILLEQLTDMRVVDRYRHILDIPAMLDAYRHATNIEILGMGYYHPIFPLIPIEDWDEQLSRGREKLKGVFGRDVVGFWPPEMAFCMEMIPALVRNGYRYVVVDHVHVRPTREVPRRGEVVYLPHVAEFEGARIAIIVRDRDLSNAQESGLDPGWFSNEVSHKLESAPSRCLVTTWSDGENGGWFRQMDEGAGFWGHFFAPAMERVRSGDLPVRPILISEFLNIYRPEDKVIVQTGAWNVGSTSGYDFTQWAGSENQRRAMNEVWGLSRLFHETLKDAKKSGKKFQADQNLREARRLLLEAETSCYFFWGDSWIPRVYDTLKPAREKLSAARASLGLKNR